MQRGREGNRKRGRGRDRKQRRESRGRGWKAETNLQTN